ncbi:MAG: type II CRISPR RNA-guided endonuclease Cas9 [Rhodanobacteraceae bacterium]
METKTKFALGLDLGSESLGWALVRLNDADEPDGIVRMGTRIFEAGVVSEKDAIETGRDESRNVNRRNARQHRRLLLRRARRLKKLYRLLQRAGLLPAGEREAILPPMDRDLLKKHAALLPPDSPLQETLPHVLPYHLRSIALDQALTPHELGRAIYHLAQRRGFWSNRKTEPQKKDKEEAKEEGKVKDAIKDLQGHIDADGARTLGRYLSTLDPTERRIRQRWTSRAMYQHEFNLIWTEQAKHHPEILTQTLGKSIYDAIFFQRPLKNQKDLVGACELEPDEKRAPWALLIAQRFRLLQRLNDLTIVDSNFRERKLTAEERAKLLEQLETKGDIKFTAVRKLLGLKGLRFNLEAGGEEKIVGNRTAGKLIQIFEERWFEMTPMEKDRIVEDCCCFVSEAALARRGVSRWKLAPDRAEWLSQTSLEPDHCSLSRKALEKLVPLMEKEMPFATARKEIYGLGDEYPPQQFLPPLTIPSHAQKDGMRSVTIRNPMVARALTEMRKVVNAIVRRYGKPEMIRIELARELKKNREQRAEIYKNNRQLQKDRERGAQAIMEEMGRDTHPKRNDLQKYLLWEECDGICPYTGWSIALNQIFGPTPQFDIEHIIPYSRCLDDSFMNKTLCHIDTNRHEKKNQTPFEAWGRDPERWEKMLSRVDQSKMPDAKKKRFRLETLDTLDGFVESQLNDTRYASKEAVKYLALLYGGKVELAIDPTGTRRVQPIRGGQVTATLRGVWQLNRLLGDGGEKNRADHRHHAVDALVIALATPGNVKQLSEAHERAPLEQRNFFGKIQPPWPTLLDEARARVDEIVVSHRVSRKVNGPLHAETNWSPPIKDARQPKKTFHQVRKPIESITNEKQIEEISDPHIREIVRAKLQELGGDAAKLKKLENHPFLTTKDGRKIPIHKVRIKRAVTALKIGTNPDEMRNRFAENDGNHHMEVIEGKDKKGRVCWEGKVITQLAAMERLRRKQPVVDAVQPGFRFSLAPGETIEIDQKDSNGPQLYRVRGIYVSPSGGAVQFVSLTDARKKDQIKAAKEFGQNPVSILLGKWKTRKVVIDALGGVHIAND